MGESTHGGHIAFPRVSVSFQDLQRSGIPASAQDRRDVLRQHRHIPQSQIQTLAAYGMQTVGGVAHQR